MRSGRNKLLVNLSHNNVQHQNTSSSATMASELNSAMEEKENCLLSSSNMDPLTGNIPYEKYTFTDCESNNTSPLRPLSQSLLNEFNLDNLDDEELSYTTLLPTVSHTNKFQNLSEDILHQPPMQSHISAPINDSLPECSGVKKKLFDELTTCLDLRPEGYTSVTCAGQDHQSVAITVEAVVEHQVPSAARKLNTPFHTSTHRQLAITSDIIVDTDGLCTKSQKNRNETYKTPQKSVIEAEIQPEIEKRVGKRPCTSNDECADNSRNGSQSTSAEQELQPQETKKKRIRDPKLILENQKKKHPIRPCCDCQKKCAINVPQTERESIYDQFWSMDRQRRRNFLSRQVQQLPTKIKTTGSSTRRHNTLIWTLNDFKVCKTFFLNTLGFTNDEAVQAVLKANVLSKNKNTTVSAAPDLRGRHPSATAFSKEYTDEMRNFILKYNPLPSHYNLKHAPNRRYLGTLRTNVLSDIQRF